MRRSVYAFEDGIETLGIEYQMKMYRFT